MSARIHGPITIIAFNTSGIWGQCYKLSKQLQDTYTHTDIFYHHLKVSVTYKDVEFGSVTGFIFTFTILCCKSQCVELPLDGTVH
jgi:hypothetical protein